MNKKLLLQFTTIFSFSFFLTACMVPESARTNEELYVREALEGRLGIEVVRVETASTYWSEAGHFETYVYVTDGRIWDLEDNQRKRLTYSNTGTESADELMWDLFGSELVNSRFEAGVYPVNEMIENLVTKEKQEEVRATLDDWYIYTISESNLDITHPKPSLVQRFSTLKEYLHYQDGTYSVALKDKKEVQELFRMLVEEEGLSFGIQLAVETVDVDATIEDYINLDYTATLPKGTQIQVQRGTRIGNKPIFEYTVE
ncbi:TPA: hypothetical protein TXT63_000446 [Streptococcus suis]|nr:hypothetical protein [Streptococcus suis]